MNNFIKENWFKVGIFIVLLVCVIFTFSFLTGQQEMKLVSVCQKLATDKKEEILKEEPLLSAKTISSFEYEYNNKINGCIVSYEYNAVRELFGKFSPFRELAIINLTTGSVLYKENPLQGEEWANALSEFEKAKEQYK